MKRIVLLALMTPLILVSGCGLSTYPPPVSQPFENVISIELLDMHEYDPNIEETTEIILYTISEDELNLFWSRFMSMKFRGYINDPARQYGILAVRITYNDGCIDIFGADMSSFTNSDGTQNSTVHADDRDDLRNLFAQYVDENELPPSDYLFLN
ncbi:MAG: hypothetical protein IJ017_03100 [Oscillospiraceae bacterium]|nr:hypothetical protein [Oscillospiraceae bacterium]